MQARGKDPAARGSGPGAAGLRRLMVPLVVALSVLSVSTPRSAEAACDLPEPTGKVLLEISGSIDCTNDGDTAVFDRDGLTALPQHTLKTTTVVTDGVKTFRGFRMQDLLDAVGAHGETAVAHALNDYVVDIPLDDFSRFEVLVALRMDGKRLTARDKGPLWIVYPRDQYAELQDIRYDYRWVWQLDRLKIR
ncbi:molybdopterin-dependent oxidoreductase [Amorphus orientalis]|uniref:Oxidoreductase molybdopterin-binding domain-containing protein n=1 Tax=Amorphus orientalis TaxID=649198 RepID=A0AAE4ARB5_9HYPH|nr:molybdopterin-dependent oxidoreductase [Amorphus orientalis]MDQ0315011.1 hypothetical protein [Amorphus orientalis]